MVSCVVLSLIVSHTIKNLFYHPFCSDVTHVRKDTRPSPALLSVLQATESWAGPGIEANYVYTSFVTLKNSYD